jgi:hypothetical protein
MPAGIRQGSLRERRRQIKRPRNNDTMHDKRRSRQGSFLTDLHARESHPEPDRPISSADRIAKDAYSFVRRREDAIHSIILVGIPRFVKSAWGRPERGDSAREKAP